MRISIESSCLARAVQACEALTPEAKLNDANPETKQSSQASELFESGKVYETARKYLRVISMLITPQQISQSDLEGSSNPIEDLSLLMKLFTPSEIQQAKNYGGQTPEQPKPDKIFVLSYNGHCTCAALEVAGRDLYITFIDRGQVSKWFGQHASAPYASQEHAAIFKRGMITFKYKYTHDNTKAFIAFFIKYQCKQRVSKSEEDFLSDLQKIFTSHYPVKIVRRYNTDQNMPMQLSGTCGITSPLTAISTFFESYDSFTTFETILKKRAYAKLIKIGQYLCENFHSNTLSQRYIDQILLAYDTQPIFTGILTAKQLQLFHQNESVQHLRRSI